MADTTNLVQRIREGDIAAENELALVFQVPVLAVLRRKMRHDETARELTNDVLMAVVCALRDGRLHDAGKLRAFVFGTARNVANNYIRTQSARPPEEPLPVDILAPDVPDGVEQREWAARLRLGMSHLRHRDRAIVIGTVVEGLAPREIAARLGVSASVVRARKSRALHRLIVSTRRGDA